MGKFQRFSKVEFQRDGITRTPEGFLVLPVTAARTGVLPYLLPDGTVVREAKLPQEVFAQDSLDSMLMIPITNDHPDPKKHERGMVNPQNAKELTVGFTGAKVAKRDEKFVETSAKVMDEKAISDVLGGKVEVSLGYSVEIDETPGTFDGEEYDVIQRNIRYNHLAIVDKGRAGPNVRLRLDSNQNQIFKGDENMKKMKFGGKEFDVADDLADALEKHMSDLCPKKDAADAKADADKARADAADKVKSAETLQAKLDAAQEKIAKLESTKIDEAELEKRATEIARVRQVAALHLDAEAMKDKKSDELKRLVVKKVSPKVEDSKLDSAAYLNARFDAIAEEGNEEELKTVGRAITGADAEEKVDADVSFAKQVAEGRDAWKIKTTVVA